MTYFNCWMKSSMIPHAQHYCISTGIYTCQLKNISLRVYCSHNPTFFKRGYQLLIIKKEKFIQWRCKFDDNVLVNRSITIAHHTVVKKWCGAFNNTCLILAWVGRVRKDIKTLFQILHSFTILYVHHHGFLFP